MHNKARRFFQLLSVLALNASWGPDAKWLCMPVLNCHSCALSFFACPIGVFSHFAGWHLFPFIALGTVLLLGAMLGRLFCGWVCPFGFLQDMLHKLPGPKIRLPAWTSYIKYVVLILGVFVLPFALGANTWFSFCRICPASALQVTIPNFVMKGLPQQILPMVVRLAFLLVIIELAILSSRAFCKMLCPIGAILSPLNYVSLWAIKRPTENCVSCGKCDAICPADGAPSSRVSTGENANREADCIVCHDCQKICPIDKRKPVPTPAVDSAPPIEE